MGNARFTYRDDDHGATGLSLAHLHSLELSAAAGERDGAGGARDDAGSRDNSGHCAVFRWKVIQERAVMAFLPDPAEAKTTPSNRRPQTESLGLASNERP